MTVVQPSFRGMAAIRPRKKREDRELAEQIAFFRWLWVHQKAHPEFSFIFAVPNGGYRPGREGRKMVESGARAGVWDICLPFPRGGHPGAYIEMKTPGAKLTPEQESFQDLVLLPGGFAYAVCRSWIEAARFTLEYLGIDDARLEDELRMSTPRRAA